MSGKPLYVYHIITSTDISEEIKLLSTYPEVHIKNEACKKNCAKYDDLQRDDSGEGKPSDGDDGGRERGDIPELGGVEEGENSSLCAGPDGVVESTGNGECRIRFRNGIRRRYDLDCSSRDRIQNGDGEMGRILAVGAYAAGAKDNITKLYNGCYKLIAVHNGTRRRHWHLIYISPNKQWGYNSRLGRIIRDGSYKNSTVDCIACLREYLYNGNGRQVLSDILSEEHIEACQCAEHNCGMVGCDQWKEKAYKADCSEGGDTIFYGEGKSPEKTKCGLVDSDFQTDSDKENDRDGDGNSVRPQKRPYIHGRKKFEFANFDPGESGDNYDRDKRLIILLCQDGAFTDGEAMATLSKKPEGIKIICSKRYAEKIRTYLHVARVLVFQESIKQRFERAKQKFEKFNSLEEDNENKLKLKEILANNNINEKEFFTNTFLHFINKNFKKNNLFFLGPPSTGKTMIMTSLVECHFNICRLTGLISNSSFNFSGLLHTNACLMDECKLTDNQFEQWKMLACGLPMSTDVKYKERCDITECRLYTCSNYPIEMYCNVPMAKEAVNSRTIKYELHKRCPWYIKISPHVWEQCWQEYGLDL